LIDLHIHSTFSDGSYTPEELAQMAADTGLSAAALTDHDTTDGVPRFLAACEQCGVSGVAGVEISVEFGPGTMHILGYFINLNNGPLQDALRQIRSGRKERNRQILVKLNSLGFELKQEELDSLSVDGVLGRPHFARAMVARGYVKDTQEAFGLWLAKGKPAYVERFRLDPCDGLRLITAAGGAAVLAHPATLDLKPGAMRRTVAGLVECGLKGIEVFYPMHNRQMVSKFYNLAIENGLELTGGSDFHGAMNPAISLGRGFGKLRIADGLLDRLRESLNRRD